MSLPGYDAWLEAPYADAGEVCDACADDHPTVTHCPGDQPNSCVCCAETANQIAESLYWDRKIDEARGK